MLWHEFYEILLAGGGSGLHVVNGAPSELARGQFALLTPADFHELVPATVPLELFNVVFSDDSLNGDVRNLLTGRSHDLDQTTAPEYIRNTVWAVPPAGGWTCRVGIGCSLPERQTRSTSLPAV